MNIPMAEQCDTLVIGAGPAGSATAIRLAAQGRHVMLVDRATFPRDKCCSEYASPETLRELQLLNVLPAVDRHDWTALDGTTVTGPSGSRLRGRFADAGGSPFRPTGMALPRRELDNVLVDAARDSGALVVEATRLAALHSLADGTITATLSGPRGERQLTARVVIGADGLGSRVARLSGLHRKGGLRRIAFVAHLTGVRGMQAHAELHVQSRTYVGLNPLDPATTNVALVVDAADAAAARGDATGYFQHRLAGFPEVADRVAAGQIVREVLVTGPFDARSRSSTTNAVALVGDAAEFFDPFTGEGICTALAGARLLAQALDPLLRSSAPITHRALTPYRRARRRHFLGKWAVERSIGHAMRWPALFDHAVGRIHRAGLASTVIGVTGDLVPASRLITPGFLWRLLRANSERRAAEALASSHVSRLTANDSHG